MSEKKPSFVPGPAGDSASVPSIQQQKEPFRNAPARGEADAAPILFVETQSLGNLLERAELDLEASFWPSAVTYADRALRLDPQNARALYVKLLADLKVSDPEQLKYQKRPIDTHPLYPALLASDDAGIRQAVAGANDYICAHLEELFRDDLDQVRHTLAHAQLAPDVRSAQDLLEKIPSFPASDELRKQCEEKVRDLFPATYQAANQCMKEYRYADAAALFESVSFDDKARIAMIDCRKSAEKEAAYLAAVAFQEKYQFREAAEAFSALEGYRDSAQRFTKCNRMIKGKKVRAVGRRHTQAAWANVFASVFTSLACLFTAPPRYAFFNIFNLNLLWGIPLVILSVILAIVKARYRGAKKMWIVMAAVFGLILVLTTTGVLAFGQNPAVLSGTLSALLYLLLTAGLIFI